MRKPTEVPQPNIVAAIPCQNEERFIGSVVLKAKRFVDRVIVIDDGSTDETAMVAEAAGALVIRHEINKGKGMAMNTAFRWAKESGVKAMVMLDGDSQHEPGHIPNVLEPVLAGEADVVAGSRFLSIKSDMPGYRTIGQRILTFVTNLGSGVKLSDTQSGFKAFSRKSIETLSFRRKGVGDVESELQFLIKENDLSVVEVPIIANYGEKAKRNPWAQGMRNMNALLNMIAERRPLFFFSLFGAALTAIGLAVGARVLYTWATTGGIATGTALISVLLLIIGVFTTFTGLVLNTMKNLILNAMKKERS